VEGDIITVTTYNDTAEQNILTQVFVGPVTETVANQEGYDDTVYSPDTVDGDPGSFDYSSTGTFTADTVNGSYIITNVSNFLSLDVGDSITGPGIQIGSIIESLDIPSSTITLSKQAIADGINVTLSFGTSYVENNFVLYQSYTDAARAWVIKKLAGGNGRILRPFIDYNIEGNINFYEELYKSLDTEDKQDNNDYCLISNQPLVENYVTMSCGHKFNYQPLFYDILNHKKKFNGQLY
jgi:hypothetical protein